MSARTKEITFMRLQKILLLDSNFSMICINVRFGIKRCGKVHREVGRAGTAQISGRSNVGIAMFKLNERYSNSYSNDGSAEHCCNRVNPFSNSRVPGKHRLLPHWISFKRCCLQSLRLHL